MVAPGTAAPLLSVTVPKIDPYTDCALAGASSTKLAQANNASTRAVRIILFMRSPEAAFVFFCVNLLWYCRPVSVPTAVQSSPAAMTGSRNCRGSCVSSETQTDAEKAFLEAKRKDIQ